METIRVLSINEGQKKELQISHFVQLQDSKMKDEYCTAICMHVHWIIIIFLDESALSL